MLLDCRSTLERKVLSSVRHGTITIPPSIQFLGSFKESEDVEVEARRDMEGTLRAREYTKYYW